MTYTTVKVIGEGAFGVVHQVVGADQAAYALKTLKQLPSGQAPHPDIKARFRREVKYQSAIDHPNVVKILDFNLEADPPWFVMHLAECTLADELEADRYLGGNLAPVLFDILAGLQAIHAKGYKHRDLKPQNILKLNFTDGSQRYAISDFGLMTPEAGLTTTLTATNAGGGTPLYCAPECTTNFRRATHLADIYSFGAILHDIFGGLRNRLPYDQLTVQGPMKDVVERCTYRQPRRRYQSVEQLREALYEALQEIDGGTISFASEEEAQIVELLSQSQTLSDDEWDRVFDLLDENSYNGQSNDAIFRVLTLEHIEALAGTSPELFESLAKDYADYAAAGTFGFEYCDVIGSRASKFFQYASTGIQAQIALALLQLGTSHNRWYVERLFMSMAGPNVSDELADRIAIEIEVQEIDFEAQFRHLALSISAIPQSLHPRLQVLLDQTA